ncbi:MAG: phosphoribosylformylglycinamidine cyclo-ligase [Candidatus Bathyarchaeia archaeon]
MTRKFTYADVGVDRTVRAASKEMLRLLKDTYIFSHYGSVVQLPYGNIFPIGKDRYLDLVVEGVGTKVLVAQLAGKYDTIGIDGVALAVNDVIRSGAKPLAIADNIHAQVSDPELIGELLKGVARGALESECVVPSGEIGDVAEVIKGLVEGRGFDLIVATVGEVSNEKVISGMDLKPGDVVVGMRSSGIHSNGVTLARKILFKHWGGKYEPFDVPDGFEREIVYEVLEPMKIYVKPLLKVAEAVKVKAAVHITGDAYLKFGNLQRFSRGIGFEFTNFKPQPIFELIQKTAVELGGRIADDEMFKTFNMGWGFAVIVDKANVDRAIEVLERSDVHSEQIGYVTDSGAIAVHYRGKKIVLK